MSSPFVELKDYLGTLYPEPPPLPATDLLDFIEVQELPAPPDILNEWETALQFQETRAFDFPGTDQVALLIAEGDGGTLEVVPGEIVTFSLVDVPLRLQISADLLQPMRRIAGSNPPRYEDDRSRETVVLNLGKITLGIDAAGGFALDFAAAVTLDAPMRIAGTDAVIEGAQFLLDFSGENKCILFQWSTDNLNRWLGQFSSLLADEGAPVSATIALRILFGGTPEIRLDWSVSGNTARIISLPGLKVKTPQASRFSVLLTEEGGERYLGLVLTVDVPDPNALPKIEARSTFAWTRGDGSSKERELQNDNARKSKQADDFDEALFRAVLELRRSASLVLMRVNLASVGLPTFFKQLASPLPELTVDAAADVLTAPSAFSTADLQSLDGTTWNGKFLVALNQALENFQLPFLKQDDPKDKFSQSIQIKLPEQVNGSVPDRFGSLDNDLYSFDLAFSPAIEATLTLQVTVNFGPFSLDSEIDVIFNLEDFSLRVDHSGGLDFLSPKPSLPPEGAKEHMGLVWSFEGAPTEDGRYRYFTLATDKYAYELQQAEGATFTVAYTKASKEPIKFIISNFSLTPKGISLVAEVSDEPVRMNGIDTRFRFNGSKLVIVENKISDFTLAGSGPLPPDLVGDAMVDIALQFQQQDGDLTLVAGGAQLRGNKLLDCKGTRFQFSIDSIGLDFVNENGFHLFFKLTGQAQFVLAPGDNPQGALAWLPNIKIELVEAPLTGDVSVLKDHIKFLVELPKPKTFNFLGCFEMELRGIGFEPAADVFDGDAAMRLTGQLRFAQGSGDTPDPRTDYHTLVIGLPEPGDIMPRIHFERIAVNINIGAAFKMGGYVNFIKNDLQEGFEGEGSLDIQGLPSFSASFAFMRVRRDENSSWLRAWFIYLEVAEFSLMIPVIQIYLREVGLGFGYRYTIASIKAADRESDVRKLLAELKKLSRTQGDLSRVDRWAIDLEEPGEDVRWTIVLRAMISQTSNQPSVIRYDAALEKDLACLFLIDAIIAFRSDLTFFMAARAWIHTNYNDWLLEPEIHEKPFFSGFVLLSPRQKRFLAHVASNREGHIGDHPPLPDFTKKALQGVRFSATLLIEPGLVHFELGWPNMLGWDIEIGPLKVVNKGGFIFRVSKEEFVIGISYLSRGSLDIDAGVDLGLVGVRVRAYADLSWGARLIAIFKRNADKFYVYGAIGLEMRIMLEIAFWIKIPLVFTTIKLDFRFSVGIGFTAALEAAIIGSNQLGIRGQGTLALSAMGHSLQFSASFAFNDGIVNKALDETKHVLDLGLEATDVEPVPGLGDPLTLETEYVAQVDVAPAGGGHMFAGFPDFSPMLSPEAEMGGGFRAAALRDPEFTVPGYTIFVLRAADRDGWSHFVLLPSGERREKDADGEEKIVRETGFLPAPPLNISSKVHYWRDDLNRGRLPVPLQALDAVIEGNRYTLADKDYIYPSSNGWFIHERESDYEIRYRVERDDEQKEPYARLTVKVESLTVRRTQTLNDVQNPVGVPGMVEYDDLLLHVRDAVAGWIFEQRARMGDAPGSLEEVKNGLHVTRREIPYGGIWSFDFFYPARNWFYTVEIRTASWNGGIVPIPFPSDLPDIFRPRFDVNVTIEKQVFVNGLDRNGQPHYLTEGEGIYADLQTAELAAGNLPDSLKKAFPEDVEVESIVLANGEPDADWIATIDGSRYLIQKITNKNPLDTMSLRLEVQSDFMLHFPDTASSFLQELEQFNPEKGGWKDLTAIMQSGDKYPWRVAWDAPIYSAGEYETSPIDPTNETAVKAENNRLAKTQPDEVEIRLGRYLNHAFQLKAFTNDSGGDEEVDQVIPVGDPELTAFAEKRLEDERVYNPSDDAFESAVRGALEQFEGSPYFKHDPNNEYERELKGAFRTDTTAYATESDAEDATQKRREQQYREQSVQLRGMVIHDLVADLRDYVEDASRPSLDGQEPAATFDITRSIPFQMGLVFRFRRVNSTERDGDWLDDLLPETQPEKKLQLQQRINPYSTNPSPTETIANPFNILRTNFSANPPQFRRVQQYTSSSTIAITWDLTWPAPPREECTPAQAEPEHHLLHYWVVRRALDGSERDVEYPVKNAEAIYQRVDDEGNTESTLTRLRPRFQVVDHFNQETEDDLAALPEEGRSYLYTITPIDFENRAGRPLTIIATRRPDAPPLVPADGLLRVIYYLDEDLLAASQATKPTMPKIVVPDSVEVRWIDPGEKRTGSKIPVASYWLIFRKEETLPVGSYGLDSETQRPAGKTLPTSNARPLPNDIKIKLDFADVAQDKDTGEQIARIPLVDLIDAGILPDAEFGEGWQPEAWRVFFQTISVNNVPSALAPVGIALIALTPGVSEAIAVEERRPAELEWLAQPIKFPLLPPEDQRAIPGMAHFPMPISAEERLGESFANIHYTEHPLELRCVRFRWNQGPSSQPDYPLDLNAGYKLLQLDIDAQTTETFESDVNLGAALREIQDVQMMPSESLLLLPGDTLTTSQWEAWYPSTKQRLRTEEEKAATRTQNVLRPWYSWRESVLEWPPETLIPGMKPNLFREVGGEIIREQAIHPYLQAIVDELSRVFTVDLQTLPPMQPQDLQGFMDSTSKATDPYGWKVLQHFGLSMALSLRDPQTGNLIIGDALLKNVRIAIITAALQLTINQYIKPQLSPADQADLTELCTRTVLPEAVAKVTDGKNTALRDIVDSALENEELVNLAGDLLGDNGIDPTTLGLFDHLYAEVLFQPGRSVNLKPDDVAAGSALAIMQLSLRPVVRQVLSYSRMQMKGAANTSISVRIHTQLAEQSPITPITFVNRADPASGQVQLDADTKPAQRSITFPMDGQTTLYFRSVRLPQVEVFLPLKKTNKAAFTPPAGLNGTAKIETWSSADVLVIKPAFSDLPADVRQDVIKALHEDEREAAQVLLTLEFEELHEVPPFWDGECTDSNPLCYDNAATYFTTPPDLAEVFSSPNDPRGGIFWADTRRYLESLNGNKGVTPKIELPTAAEDIEKLMGDFFAWSQRFFDHSGLFPDLMATPRRTAAGPWLVTAYPRAGSPAYATPDEGGRLKYDHIYEDKWAHNYRYYIQPYGRYDRLWHSYRQSSALSETPYDDRELLQPLPDPEMGGLDVVIDRTQRVDAPLILSSRRLDAAAEPGVPVAPGSLWEVIIAQHPEQALIERNQTLARQIAFRQVAFTLLRRYAFEAWLPQFMDALTAQSITDDFADILVRTVQQETQPTIPSDYPSLPEHIDFDGEYTSEDVRSIGLPSRIGRFQQGALVLQWDGLPFYYEHRLLTFAQTANTVSRINQVTQRDFEYITPQLINDELQRDAQTEGIDFEGRVEIEGFQPQTLAVRLQSVEVTLKRFWDSLPQSAKDRWPDEMPDSIDSTETKRKFSSLPDPDVIYQIIEVLQGNVEVQAEVFNGLNEASENRYQIRQLARAIIALPDPDQKMIIPPALEQIHGDYRFTLNLLRLTAVQPESVEGTPPDALRSSVLRIANDPRYFLVGAMTQAQYGAWMEWVGDSDADRATIQTIYDSWTVQEPVSPVAEDFPRGEAFVIWDDVIHLVWDATLSDEAPLSPAEREALRSIEGDLALLQAVERLLDAIDADPTQPVYHETLPIPIEEIEPNGLPDNFSIQEMEDGSFLLCFSGSLFDAEYDETVAALHDWAVLPELRTAADCLLDAIEKGSVAVDLQRTRPTSEEIPENLGEHLQPTETGYKWDGDITEVSLAALTEYAALDDFAGKDIQTTLQNLHTSLTRRFGLDVKIVPDDEGNTGIPDALPEELTNSLIIVVGGDEANPRLRWQGATPSDEQREVIDTLVTGIDTPFAEALRELLARLDTLPSVQLPFGVDGAAFADFLANLPEEYSELVTRLRLEVNAARQTITWLAPAPTNAEWELIAALVQEEMLGRYEIALRHLFAAVDAEAEMLFPPLPELPLEQVSIAEGQLVWTGRAHDAQDLETLDDMVSLADADFAASAEDLIAKLEDTEWCCPVEIGVRNVPEELQGKLLLTRTLLRYTGMMTQSEGQDLLDQFEQPMDRNAVQRLYDQSANPTINGRKMLIRTRRGSAAPSSMISFTAKLLSPSDE